MWFYPVAVSLLSFTAYLELSPGLGNIWWRNGRFMPSSIVRMVTFCLTEKAVWRPSLWDLNYCMWLTGSVLGYFIAREI